MRKLSRLLGFQNRVHARTKPTHAVTLHPEPPPSSSPRRVRRGGAGMTAAAQRLAKTAAKGDVEVAATVSPMSQIRIEDLDEQDAHERALDDAATGMSSMTSSTNGEGRNAEQAVDVEAIQRVTLVVYGWHNVQPGTLSWVFPSLHAAVAAVRAMKNAVKWAIVAGQKTVGASFDLDIDAARAHGTVLLEAL